MGTWAIATIVLLGFLVGLIVGRWWIAVDPVLLGAAWWAFRYTTASFPDPAAARHGVVTAIAGTLLAEAGVAAGLVARRAARRLRRGTT